MNLKDTDRLRGEWWELSPYLQQIICDVNLWCLSHNQRNSTWTCFMRTEAEQRDLFERQQADSPTSVHMVGRGADMRLLDKEELNNELLGYINHKYGPYDPARPHLQVAMIHGGTARHFHFQTLT
jgi:hypothetical protein